VLFELVPFGLVDLDRDLAVAVDAVTKLFTEMEQ